MAKRIQHPVRHLWCLLALGTPAAFGQATTTEYNLDDSEGWVEVARPEPGTPAAVIAEARTALVEGNPGRGYALIDRWIRETDPRTDKPRIKTDRGIEFAGGDPVWLPQAYLLRGDCLLAMDQEWHALSDYEINIAARFPESDVFPIALERQFEISKLYLNGLKRRLFGFRFESATDDAIEALLRIQERMPRSELAERAAIEVMDYYYRTGQLELATTMSDIYLTNYPRGQRRVEALTLSIKANLALYRGPTYDGSSLIDAGIQIKRLMNLYPIVAEQQGLGETQLSAIEQANADQLFDTARWYLQRGDEPSAVYTMERLVRKHPRSEAAALALKLMTDNGWVRTGEEFSEMEQTPMQGPPTADYQSDETPSENPEQDESESVQ